MSRCILLACLSLLLISSRYVLVGASDNSSINPLCSSMNMSACLDECFVQMPPRNVYLSEGDKVNLTTEPVKGFVNGLLFFDVRKDGVVVEMANQNDYCNPVNCIFDFDSPILEITSFTDSVEGEYEWTLVTTGCTITTNVAKAEPPKLEKENNDTIILNADEGPLTLSPVVFHGVPPGNVTWYKNNVMISTGDSYTKQIVTAGDRGNYRAEINHQTGIVDVEYQVLVRFIPLVTIQSDPVNPNPDSVINRITMTCKADSYPEAEYIGIYNTENLGTELSTTKSLSTQLQPEGHYESTAEYVIMNGCPSMEFECQVRNNQGIGFSTRLRICQKAPNITSLRVSKSTNVSVTLQWTPDPEDNVPNSYEIRYRRSDGESFVTSISNEVENFQYQITGLNPGVMYTFQVRAVDKDDQMSFVSIEYTTFRRPINKPTELQISGNHSMITLTWRKITNYPAYAPVSNYSVYYYTSVTSTPVLASTLNSNTDMLKYMLADYNTSLTYTFFVRANNAWGEGDNSGEVILLRQTDPQPSNIQLSINVSVDSSRVQIYWRVDTPSVTRDIKVISVLVSRLESESVEQVQFFPVSSQNITDVTITDICFDQLNSSDTYQFCVRVYDNNDRLLAHKCVFRMTSDANTKLDINGRCHSVAIEQPKDELIPTWGIAVMVVGAVVLVFLFFGGCGLFFALKKNKKSYETEYMTTNDMFDKQSPINGGNYPYPPPARPVSPSPRTCMSRHKNHGHSLNWQNQSWQGQGVTNV